MKRHVFHTVFAVGIAYLLLLPTTAPLHAESAFTNAAAAYNDRSDPARLLASYYDAINTSDFARAYDY